MKPALMCCLAGVTCLSVLIPSEGRSDSPPVIDVSVDTNHGLPRVWLIPADEGARNFADKIAKTLALAGMYDPAVGTVGQQESGLSVKVSVSSDTDDHSALIELDSGRSASSRAHRLAHVSPGNEALDLARMADAIVLDLSGQRSHLSGKILFTDVSKPGSRTISRSLATGQEETVVSPKEYYARGADFGPGDHAYFAAGRIGDISSLFEENSTTPVPAKVPDQVQGVAISRAGDRIAVVAGTDTGSALYTGRFLGQLDKVSSDEVAIDPAFGPGGELAYASGPLRGPLRIMVGTEQVSPAGVWAESPSFCAGGTTPNLVYGATDGMIRFTNRIGSTRTVVRGHSPACSPDGRAVLFARDGAQAGLYIVGLDGGTPKKIRDGAASNLRWSTGRPLPPIELG